MKATDQGEEMFASTATMTVRVTDITPNTAMCNAGSPASVNMNSFLLTLLVMILLKGDQQP